MRLKDIPNATPDQMLHNLLDVLTALRDGHFTAHMIDGFPGIYGEIAKVLNQHLDTLGAFRQEHHRLMEEIGVTGRLGGQMEVKGLCGAWKQMLEEVNQMGGNVTGQFRDGANIVEDLLKGDLSARMTARCIQGEFADFREHLNKLAEEYEQRSAAPASV
jgi:hypothetical protein